MTTTQIVIVLLILYFLFSKKSKEGYATALSGFNNIVLTDDLGNMNSIQFPSRIIVLWSGDPNQIPEGWALCDGNNGTPDLRGRFVVGVNPNNNRNPNFSVYEKDAKDGGAESVTLQTSQIPGHTHNYGDATWLEDYNWYQSNWGGMNYNGGGNFGGNRDSLDGGNQAIGVWRTTDAGTGGGQAHENRPPFYALAYIMKK